MKTRVKTIVKNNEIEMTFTQGSEVIGNHKLYINECAACKQKSVDKDYYGSTHICKRCLAIFNDIKSSEKKPTKPRMKKEIKVTNTIDIVDTKPTTPKQVSRKSTQKYSVSIMQAAENYFPDMKIVDFVEKYQNVMNKRISEKTATMICELVLKGYNTVAKIAAIINCDKLDTVYNYMITMATAGMLYVPASDKSRNHRVFKINPALTYTKVAKA